MGKQLNVYGLNCMDQELIRATKLVTKPSWMLLQVQINFVLEVRQTYYARANEMNSDLSGCQGASALNSLFMEAGPFWKTSSF